MPYRDSSHQKYDLFTSFTFFWKLFKPNKHTENYHVGKPNDKIFLFQIEDKKYIYVGKKLFCFETNDEIVS